MIRTRRSGNDEDDVQLVMARQMLKSWDALRGK